jgi:hypothetical protein
LARCLGLGICRAEHDNGSKSLKWAGISKQHVGVKGRFQIPAEKIGNAFSLSLSSVNAGGGVSPSKWG